MLFRSLMSVKLRTLACWMGWPPPLMQPPGQAMNSTKSYWREPVSYTHLDVYKRQVEIHARNASHLVGQVIGDRRLQRKEADQDGDKQGGQAAVEQLAYQIGAHGQAAAPDEGEHLTVDGDCLLYTSRCV